MTRYIKTAVILFLICAVCTALCAVVNEVTAPVIAQSVEADRVSALSDVSAGYGIGEQVDVGDGSVNYYVPLLDGDAAAGYIVELQTSGYGGAMTVIASYKTDGTLMEAKLMANSETPGLGKKAEDSSYMDKFRGLGGSEPLPASKSDLSAEDNAAVSGASVTFNGIASALINGSNFVKELGGIEVTETPAAEPEAPSVPDDVIAALSGGLSAGEKEEVGEGIVTALWPLSGPDGAEGYLLQLDTEGFAGPMTVAAAYSADGAVTAAKLLANSETPGYGKAAEEDSYMAMFAGLGSDEAIPSSLEELGEEERAAVSGASVTFGSISAALIEGSEYVKGLGGAV